jgi:hypothetical protein
MEHHSIFVDSIPIIPAFWLAYILMCFTIQALDHCEVSRAMPCVAGWFDACNWLGILTLPWLYDKG